MLKVSNMLCGGLELIFVSSIWFVDKFPFFCSPSISVCLHSSRTTMQNLSSKLENVVTSEDLKPSEPKRRGSAGVVGSMMLLKSYQYMHAPFTQVDLTSLASLPNCYFIYILYISNNAILVFSLFMYLCKFIIGGTNHDRRHARRTTPSCGSFWWFICKLLHKIILRQIFISCLRFQYRLLCFL